jgi:hypothetical protein
MSHQTYFHNCLLTGADVCCINLMHEYEYVYTTSCMVSLTPYKHIFSSSPSQLLLTPVCTLYQFFLNNSECKKQNTEICSCEITFYQWMSAIKNQGLRWHPWKCATLGTCLLSWCLELALCVASPSHYTQFYNSLCCADCLILYGLL